MGPIQRTGLTLTALAFLSPLAAAQNPPPDTQARQPPAERDGLGTVSLKIETTLPENQGRFARGVAFLHARSYLQAEREFMQIVVTEKDPPMAYWGLAWANFDEPDRAADFIERGVLYLDKATATERRWIEALARFYEIDPATAQANQNRREKAGPTEAVPSRKFRRPRKRRVRDLADALRTLAEATPTSPAAVFFYADLAQRFEDLLQTSKVERGKLLRSCLDAHPTHAGRYHFMELWRWTDPDRARATASTVGATTPAVAKQWYAAGRVLDACGDAAAAASMFERAMRLAHRDMQRYRLMPFRIEHYPMICWLRARALIRCGQVQAALSLARRLEAMPRHPIYNQLGNPFHLAGLAPRIRVAAFAATGDRDALAQHRAADASTMNAHRFGKVMHAADLATTWLAKFEVKKAKPLVQSIEEARADAWPKHQAARIDAWRERLAQLLKRAREVPGVVSHGTPTSAGADTLLASWTPARRDDLLDFYFDTQDRNRQAAKPDPLPRLAPADASFGPATWQPFAAPDSVLKRLNGTSLQLRSYRGKPLVAIQYLGFGCLHCVEQLRKFHPHVGAYRAAGLKILAIGTDTPKNMREAIVDLPPSEKLAYTMLSDRKMRTFRSWRAYDSFRHLPLHGTYLIDKYGKVLWQDISWQPFEKPRWFLKECTRLLGSATGK